ncbi:MAG: hypothetical protein EYC70_14650 [Planctomycetota bacterium]|nr:MAG: hypothetical protein EYC70_14650 [Planctomycetota bacterium]
MTRRAAWLALVLAAELLAGVALRNEALAVRASVETHVRSWIRCDQDRRDQAAFRAAFCAPEAVLWRWEQKRKNAENRRPEL